MISILNENEKRSYEFPYGFIITSDQSIETNNVSSIQDWEIKQLGSYRVLYKNKTTSYFVSSNGIHAFLLGHAFNPITMEYRELNILEELIMRLESVGCSAFTDYLNQLTGVFLIGDRKSVV